MTPVKNTTGFSSIATALLIAAAIALGALIFGLGGGVTVANLAIWAVMTVAVASAVMLYAKPKPDNTKTHMSEKK